MLTSIKGDNEKMPLEFAVLKDLLQSNTIDHVMLSHGFRVDPSRSLSPKGAF